MSKLTDELRLLGSGCIGTISGHHAETMIAAADRIEELESALGSDALRAAAEQVINAQPYYIVDVQEVRYVSTEWLAAVELARAYLAIGRKDFRLLRARVKVAKWFPNDDETELVVPYGTD